MCAEHGIDHEVRDVSLTDVYRADEMFCTGTMGELAAVTTVDGRTIGTGEPGPMTGRLSELYRRETARAGYPVLEVVAGG
jgi:branched-chain amino acid aminotransferase